MIMIARFFILIFIFKSLLYGEILSKKDIEELSLLSIFSNINLIEKNKDAFGSLYLRMKNKKLWDEIKEKSIKQNIKQKYYFQLINDAKIAREKYINKQVVLKKQIKFAKYNYDDKFYIDMSFEKNFDKRILHYLSPYGVTLSNMQYVILNNIKKEDLNVSKIIQESKKHDVLKNDNKYKFIEKSIFIYVKGTIKSVYFCKEKDKEFVPYVRDFSMYGDNTFFAGNTCIELNVSKVYFFNS